MDLSIFSRNNIGFVTLDDKYLPTAIVLPFEGNARQSKVIHAQAGLDGSRRIKLWTQLIRQKISNQSRVLSILGLDGAEKVASYTALSEESVDFNEALAAKYYFEYYHDGLNRRSDDPVNSRLNYGYAILRSYIARTLVSAGFQPALGLHHSNQLNAFNLADDLIEPYRAMVDLAVHNNLKSNTILSKTERHELTQILYNACISNGAKVSIMTSIDVLIESLKRYVLCETDEELKLPVVLPIERMEGITE